VTQKATSPPEIHYWMPFGQLVFLKPGNCSVRNSRSSDRQWRPKTITDDL